MYKAPLPLLFIVAVSYSFEARAQLGYQAPLTDQNGKSVLGTKFAGIDGSPYLFDQWVPGKATTDDGKVYDKLMLKYNAYNDQLSFVYSSTDEPQKFEEPVKTFTIFSAPQMVFVNGFPKIDRQNIDSYYEVISAGKTILLKHYSKLIKDTRTFNAMQVNGQYTNAYYYYIYRDNKMIRIKPNKDAVLAALADKAAQINTYLSGNTIDFKKDEDLSKLFDYYNTL
jgi:hypothetical protein